MTDEIWGVDEEGNALPYSQVRALMATDAWYRGCHDWYDNSCEPTLDGMLGGLTDVVHQGDVIWTQKYLRRLSEGGAVRIGKGAEALDCGAGIGRVAHYALKPVVEHVDTVEGTASYVRASERNFAKDSIRNRYCQRLEHFDASQFGDTRYDFAWIQWLIGHLTDEDVVSLLRGLKGLLKPDGKIIMKENCPGEGFMFDRHDTNLLRNYSQISSLINAAGLRILEDVVPETWPTSLYSIRAFLLAPA